MGSHRTPIKCDCNLKNIVYVFLGDANLAMRIVLSVVQKPSWYNEEEVWLYCSMHDIQYAPWDGKLNLIHIPGSKRTHPLIGVRFNGDSFPNNNRMLTLKINAIDDYEKPEIPEFKHMSPLEVIRISRCPIPQRLDLDWQVNYQGISELEMSAVSIEEGIPVDACERKRKKSDPSYLDDIYEAWGLANIT